jgi:hypothetical protein
MWPPTLLGRQSKTESLPTGHAVRIRPWPHGHLSLGQLLQLCEQTREIRILLLTVHAIVPGSLVIVSSNTTSVRCKVLYCIECATAYKVTAKWVGQGHRLAAVGSGLTPNSAQSSTPNNLQSDKKCFDSTSSTDVA